MKTPTLPLAAAVLIGMAAGPPTMLARHRQSSAGPTATPAGKILWQFNTNG